MYLGKQRKLNRWQGYDYSMPGQYYITICTQNRICHFGEVIDNEMVLNDLGQIVKKQWLWLPENFDYIKLDEWQIMPNHLHGVIEIIDNPVGTILELSLQKAMQMPKRLPISRIIGAFKTTSSKLIHQHQNNFYFDWQRSFHDRVIRENDDLESIRYYIRQNPARWVKDRNNPINIKK